MRDTNKYQYSKLWNKKVVVKYRQYRQNYKKHSIGHMKQKLRCGYHRHKCYTIKQLQFCAPIDTVGAIFWDLTFAYLHAPACIFCQEYKGKLIPALHVYHLSLAFTHSYTPRKCETTILRLTPEFTLTQHTMRFRHARAIHKTHRESARPVRSYFPEAKPVFSHQLTCSL